jgi:NAD(P)-dependent dehydrogenase (short-subunit alcohol dehydrogenase family)
MKYPQDYFKGKTAIVTGAASGIGLALIEELLVSSAAKVVMADINTHNLRQHETRLQLLYGSNRVKGIVCDITSEENVRQMVTDAADFFGGKIDLMFNNAGALFKGWFEGITNAEWKKAFDLNFYGALYGTRAALSFMLKQDGGGQIINIISGIAFMPMAEWTPYAATKAALNALTVALRSEFWDRNIKISSATPGTTTTAIWGDKEAPKGAQTPQESATRILRGTAKNQRIIFGDIPDRRGAAYCFNYKTNKSKDKYLLRVARERQKGKTAI